MAEGKATDSPRVGKGLGGHWMIHLKGKKALGLSSPLRSWIFTVLLATCTDLVFGSLHRAP